MEKRKVDKSIRKKQKNGKGKVSADYKEWHNVIISDKMMNALMKFALMK